MSARPAEVIPALTTHARPADRRTGGRGAAPDLYHVAKANNFTPEEAARAIVGMRHNYHEGDRSTPPPVWPSDNGNGDGHGPSAARPTQRPDGR